MQSFPLIRNQLVPPRIKSLLRRERLLDAGLSILSFRITTVIAPAGYGKSVWIASLTEEERWPETAWLSLDENNREPMCFFYHLIHAVQSAWPEFGSESLRTLNSLVNIHHDWPIAAATFLGTLQDKDLVLVLDDFHLVQESEIHQKIIEYFLRWMPANIHLIIISREQPRLNLSSCCINGSLLEINSEQLLFTEDESKAFYHLLSLELDEESLAMLQQATEGWAVCLRLAATLLMQSGANMEKTLKTIESSDSVLYRYLGHELLAFFPVKLSRFLIESSLLPYLEEKLCNAALKCKDSRARIEKLHAAGLLSRVEGGIVTWRMHYLIKEYLNQEIYQTSSPEYIADIRRRSSSFLEKRGEIDQSIEQAVESIDWARVAELICKYGYEHYTQTGRLDALYKWVEKLPEALVAEDPWLLYYKGRSIMQTDYQGAMQLFTEAAEKSFLSGNFQCEAFCLLAMSYSLVVTGDMKQGQIIMQRLKNNPQLIQDRASYGAALLVTLGNTIFTDDIEAGLEYSRIALRLKLNSELRMLALLGSAVVHHRAGNLSKARLLLEEALNMPFVQENERWSVTIYLILSTVLNLIGDSPTVMEICQKGIALARKYRMFADEARLHRNLARMYHRERRFSEARLECEESYASFAESGSISHAIYNRIELALVQMHIGESSRDLLVESLQQMSKLEADPIGQGGDQVALSVVGILAVESGELDYARGIFEKLVDTHRQNGTNHQLAGSHLILSYIYLLQGSEQIADKSLRKALSMAESRQWINFWEWYETAIFTMCRRAVQKKIHTRWAMQILNRWFPNRIRHELGQLLISPQENLRTLAQSQLDDLYNHTGKATIHLFYFNKFRVFINGWEIPGTEWKTQKVENLFKLVAADRRNYTKEILVEKLWPESKSGDANLRMALSQVRKVLCKYGADKESIVLHKKAIYLSPSSEWYTDFDLFTSEVQNAIHYQYLSHPQELSCLEQAASIYSGPFLSENIYDVWTHNKRIHFQGLYLQVLKRLAELYTARNEYNRAVYICKRYLKIESSDEVINRMLMRLLVPLGQRQKAMTVYQELVRTLNSEYNTIPEQETTELYESIRLRSSFTKNIHS